MRKNRPAALAAALALVALLGACGGDGDDDTGDVATLGSDDDGTDTTGVDGEAASDAPTDPEEAALAFAACMRENGIDMPDPEFTSDGGMAMSIGGGPGEFDEEAMEAAQAECEPIMANVRPSEEDMPSDEEIQEMQDRALEAAQCMREHGYDWPDPVFEDGGRMTQMMGGEDSGIDPEDPQFQADQEECMGGEGMMIGGGPAGAQGSTGDGPTVEGSGGDAPDVIAPSDAGDE
jgi:hypothetical protein